VQAGQQHARPEFASSSHALAWAATHEEKTGDNYMKAEARALILALGAAVTVACGGRAKPAPTPVPAHPPTTTAAVPVANTDSLLAGLDSMPQVDISIPDSLLSRQLAAVFGDSAVPAAADTAVPEGPTWDIDVRSYEGHRRVEFYVKAFTGTARDRFISRLERGSRYEPMIRAKLRAGNIPEDMYYLALVESGFDQHAYSRAAAVGVWQFMTATARSTGLRVDWWVDERRDVVRSTDAAVKFLGWLREQFGSLYLAAAAYNGGPGRVARGLSRLGDDDATGDDAFFALAERDYLRGETKNYVPQLIAAALIAKEPARWGMTLRTLPPLAYDSVYVPASTPLSAIAKASGAPLDSIRELNPQILRGVTPPGGRFLARVPVGHASGFDSAFASLAPAERRAFTRVEAKKGQTLASIASKAGVSARQLRWYNPKVSTLKSGRLRAGQVVLVPARAVVSAALDVPDPAIEIYGATARRGSRTHVVRRGETLGGIAKRYGTSVSAIVRLNRLKKQTIYPGQELLVRGAARKATPPKRIATKSTAPKSSASKAGATKPTTSKSSTAKSASSKGKTSATKVGAAKTTMKARTTASRQ
jgi:membrane-bound lytic murein transglycosylase D